MIETNAESLDSSNSTTLTFSWNTDGLTVGSHILYLRVELFEDIDPLDNVPEIKLIITGILGDINGDFKVTLVDLVLLANAYGSVPGDTRWNPNADINSNGAVDLADLVILALHYNQHYNP
jgi:hypothetical protein